MNQAKWDQRYMDQAQLKASWSKDSVQVGAVIVTPDYLPVSDGFNGPPRGVDDEYFMQYKGAKLHAEENAILLARRDLRNHTIYIWPLMCCDHCAAMIAQVGITRVVIPYQEDNEVIRKWKPQFDVALEILQARKIKIDVLSYT